MCSWLRPGEAAPSRGREREEKHQHSVTGRAQPNHDTDAIFSFKSSPKENQHSPRSPPTICLIQVHTKVSQINVHLELSETCLRVKLPFSSQIKWILCGDVLGLWQRSASLEVIFHTNYFMFIIQWCGFYFMLITEANNKSHLFYCCNRCVGPVNYAQLFYQQRQIF